MSLWNTSVKIVVSVLLLQGTGLFYLLYIHPKRHITIVSCDTLMNDTCHIISVADVMKHGREHKYPNGIPRIIHYMDKTRHIPSQYTPHARQCMLINKDAMFVFWSHQSAEKFVKEHFPRYIAKYQSYVDIKHEGLLVSDVNRYFILYHFGGVYMDLDTRCQKPFKVSMERRSCILSTQLKVDSRIHSNYDVIAMNSLMACVSTHEFFKTLLDKLIPGGRFDQTGPAFLTNEYFSYNRTSPHERDPMRSVVLADEEEFSPITVEDLEGLCRQKLTEKWKIQGCKELADHRSHEREKEKQAVVVHLYMHLGYSWMANAIKTRDNICTTLDEIYLVC